MTTTMATKCVFMNCTVYECTPFIFQYTLYLKFYVNSSIISTRCSYSGFCSADRLELQTKSFRMLCALSLCRRSSSAICVHSLLYFTLSYPNVYIVFIEIAEVHCLEVELAVALNCHHQTHNHLVYINFPLSVIIHSTMTSVYKKYQCNQHTIDEFHRLHQIDWMVHRPALSTPTSIQVNTIHHCHQPHHQQQVICERSPALRRRTASKWNNHS